MGSGEIPMWACQRSSGWPILTFLSIYDVGIFHGLFKILDAYCSIERRIVLNTSLSAKDAYCVMLRSYPDVLDIHQIARILGVSTKTGYRLLHAGTISSLKIGRSYRVPKAYLLSYLQSANSEKLSV
jgi:excisionase family DNA binding protein